MKIAVVDDERPARSELVYLLRQCSPEAEIREADSSEKLLQLLEEENFDVCFVGNVIRRCAVHLNCLYWQN